MLSGIAVMGVILLLIPFINNLGQLYALFAIMSIGITLGTGPILTKIVSGWFHTRRELTLKLISGAGSMGAMVLCRRLLCSWCCSTGRTPIGS